MSLASLNFLFRADTENFERKLKQTKKNVGGFSSDIKALGGVMAGAFSVEMIREFGNASLIAFDESEKAGALLLTTLNGNAEAFRRLSDQAGLLQSNSLFDDEAIKGAQMFLSSMKLSETQITRLIPLIMDFSTKTGQDLTSSANLMAKTIGSGTNALKRYGIEVEGAAGSSERFNMVVSGLEKQVGGLSKAATEAGTSGLVQLKNAINDIQEVIGGELAQPLNKFVQNLKFIIELRRGILKQNYATELETEARALVASSKSTDEARTKLKEWIELHKAIATPLENEAKKYDELAKKHWANGQAMREDHDQSKLLREQSQAQIDVSNKMLTLMRSEADLQGIIDQANQKVILSEEELLKLSKEKTAAYEKEQKAYRELMALTGKPIDETLNAKKRDEQIAALSRINGVYKKDQPALAPNQNSGLVDLETIVPKEGIDQLTKAIVLTDQLSESMLRLGDQLSQGADSWKEFGNMALNALKQVVAGLIAKGVASTVEKALSTLPVGVGLAVGALSGGLAAGLFNTLIPKFADGGYAASPMFAQIGDAKDGKGEWVLNSGQMKGLMGLNAQPIRIIGESRIRNNDILISWKGASNFQQRTGGR